MKSALRERRGPVTPIPGTQPDALA